MSDSLTKSQIIELCRKHLFSPKKRLGQNFLIDKNVAAKIINEVSPKEKDFFVEIGAGFGILTFPLSQTASNVLAFEIDPKICHILKDKTSHLNSLKIECKDFLKADLADSLRGKKVRLIGNLPYYITTPIIERLVELKNLTEDIHIMVQKEVADRLSAKTGEKEYSSITIFANFNFIIKKLFVVKRTCFWPQPKVDSVFLKLKNRSSYETKARDEKLFFDIVRSAFGQRRKMLINAMMNSNYRRFEKMKLESALERTGLCLKCRAEEVSLENFIRLSNEISTP